MDFLCPHQHSGLKIITFKINVTSNYQQLIMIPIGVSSEILWHILLHCKKQKTKTKTRHTLHILYRSVTLYDAVLGRYCVTSNYI